MNIADRTDVAVLVCALASTLERPEFSLDNPGVRAAVLAWVEVAESLCGREAEVAVRGAGEAETASVWWRQEIV